VAAYNEGPLLAAALDSALGQTYPHIEVVVVNDGSSSPTTRETVERYLQSKRGRIIYVERETNGGVAAARNSGIAVANGDLIAWLDQDDRWLPDRVEQGISVLQTHRNLGLVHSSYYYIDASGRRTGMLQLRQGEYAPLPDLLLDIDISPCTVLFHRRILDEVGHLDAELPGADDWYWALQVAARGYRFYSIKKPLAEYRIHEANTFRKLEVMVPSWLGMLDKFYARKDLPPEALRYRNRAYFARHAAAAALYFGRSELGAARDHLCAAARFDPQGAASGRLLQSLIYSRERRPSPATAREAAEFVQRVLRDGALPLSVARSARARALLIVAMHNDHSRPGQSLRALFRVLAADPAIVLDKELWVAAGRRISRAAARVLALTRRATPNARSTTE
jgi:glycosyltransferase involved in cell wall biosynthesis